MWRRLLGWGLAASWSFIAIGVDNRAAAIALVLDYRHDTFFSGQPTARAAIEAAAADLSNAITTTLSAINNDVIVGSSGSTTATYDMSYGYTNPTSGSPESIETATIGANEIRLFVGGRNISGTTLGQGGPAGLGYLASGSGFENQWITAVNNANAQANAHYGRGGGPTLKTLSLDLTFGSTTATARVAAGPAYGNLWFDLDGDNNGQQDSNAALNSYWHWNHEVPVAGGKNDLYSVALHEMLHALGVGSAESWDNLISGTSWTGSEVRALAGSGTGLVASDGGHIASSTMSTRISDGQPQEVVMDPTITVGTRKELTLLDLAFLRDIGYETISVSPQSADFDQDGDVDGDDFLIWQTGFGTSGSATLDTGDADGDRDVDGDDFLIWQSRFGSSAGGGQGAATVPEPSAILLGVVAYLWAAGRLERWHPRQDPKRFELLIGERYAALQKDAS